MWMGSVGEGDGECWGRGWGVEQFGRVGEVGGERRGWEGEGWGRVDGEAKGLGRVVERGWGWEGLGRVGEGGFLI